MGKPSKTRRKQKKPSSKTIDIATDIEDAKDPRLTGVMAKAVRVLMGAVQLVIFSYVSVTATFFLAQQVVQPVMTDLFFTFGFSLITSQNDTAPKLLR